jgi:ABC-type uncharacterized transport system, permease component
MFSVLSWLNSTLYDGLPYAIVTLSFVITFKYIRFPDVTSAGTFVLGAAAAAIAVVTFGLNPYLAIAIALVAGALGGILTGVFHAVLKMDHLLAGILSAFSLYAINLMLLHPTLPYGTAPTVLSPLEVLDREMTWANMAWHPFAIGYFLVIVLLIKLILDWFFASETGLAIRALEDEVAGEFALRRQGMSPGRFKVLALAFGNSLVALAGALVSMKESAANAHRGFDVLITGLIAFLIGTQLHHLSKLMVDKFRSKRKGGIPGLLRPKPTTSAIIGAIVYFGLIALAQRVNVRPEVTKLILAAYVAVAVGDMAAIKRVWRRRAAMNLNNGAATATMNGKSALSLEDISYGYPLSDVDVLRDVKLDLKSGELVLLEGGNGSGKTTLLRLIAGIIPAPNSGDIYVESQKITNNSASRLSMVGYVDQNPQQGVVGTLTVEENLALAHIGRSPQLWQKALNNKRKRFVQGLFTATEFPKGLLRQNAGMLSGGQRQLVNILTLLGRPRLATVVLLDEPMNNLDASNAERCRNVIERIHRQGSTILIVSHATKGSLSVDRTIRMDELNGA